jgi:hypothetical protein
MKWTTSPLKLKQDLRVLHIIFVATPLWAKCDCRGQNTSHWSGFFTVGKALKCWCPKWPRMSHLDICSLSYEQKKGRESNRQFDSQSLKVGNRPDSDVYRRSATWRWKALEESYKIASDLIPIKGLSKKLWMPKVPGVQPRTVSGLLLGNLGKKCHSDVAPAGSCREYYMGEGGGFPRVQAVVSQVSSRSPVAWPNTKRVQNEFYPTCGWFGCRTV